MAVAAAGIWLLALGYGEPLSAYAAAGAAAVAAVAVVFRTGLGLGRGVAPPARTQAAIGAFIRGLVLFQAACLFLMPLEPWWGLGALACWPAGMLLGRWFYGS